MGRSLPPQRFPGFQSRSRSLRRVPHLGRTVVAGGRRGRGGERGAGLRRPQARDAGDSQGDRRDRIGRRRPCAHRVRDCGADWCACRSGARLGDSICGRLAVRIFAADSARALDRAESHWPWAGVRPLDGARLLDCAARASARRARDHTDPRPGRGAPGLAAQALPCRRSARRSSADRACRPDQSATVDRSDGRGRDGWGVSRAAACRLRPCLSRAPHAPVALRRVAHGARCHSQAGRADTVCRAVAGLGPHGARRAHSHRCEHAGGIARL